MSKNTHDEEHIDAELLDDAELDQVIGGIWPASKNRSDLHYVDRSIGIFHHPEELKPHLKAY